MNKPTHLWLHPPLLPNPILDDIFHYPISCKWRMPFSLLKCYDRVIERNYSPVTLQRWLHEACGFIKKTSGVMERERERANTSIQLECILPDVLSRSLEMVEKAAVEEETGGASKQRGAHTSTTIFLCISRPPTTWRQSRVPGSEDRHQAAPSWLGTNVETGFVQKMTSILHSGLPEMAAALWPTPLWSIVKCRNTLMSPTVHSFPHLVDHLHEAETMGDYYSTSSRCRWKESSGPAFIPFTTVAILSASIFITIVIFFHPTSLWSGQAEREPQWNYVTAWCLWAALLCQKQDIIFSCTILEIHSHKDESLFSSRLWRCSRQLWCLPKLQPVLFISDASDTSQRRSSVRPRVPFKRDDRPRLKTWAGTSSTTSDIKPENPQRLTAQNSSKDILPSPSLSALIMVLSTICWSCVSFRLLPTIIFSTWKSSPLEM